MSLFNPALLFGFGLAAIPVILHFLMRPRPKKLLFPALRLIEVRKRQNVRRMRLRHIWLMLLRVAVIGLLVFALARPRLPAADYSLQPRELLSLFLVIALCLGAYWGVLTYWRRQRLPNHVLSSRRGVLRGGAGVAALLLFLLLVGWPYQRRIAAEIAGPVAPTVNLPVAGVFLFDASLSMSYRQAGKTRLEAAQEIASEHIRNMPSGSRAAVADTSTDSPILFQADRSAAKDRIDRLQVHAVGHALNDRLRTALRLQEEDRRRMFDGQTSVPEDLQEDRFLREIYLFTDLARSSWRQSAASALRDELERLPWAAVYLIDVGAENPTNVGITSLRLSKQTIPLGGELHLQATLEAAGLDDVERTVELHVQNDNGQLIKQDQSTVTVGSKAAAQVQFTARGLNGPINQGELRLISSDPLPADDVRYFTVEVRPPPEILIVAPSRDAAMYWMEALAPSELARQGRSRYRCTYLPSNRLNRLIPADFRKYAAVCLINVPAPSSDVWSALDEYVDTGGGLAVFLGSPDVDPVYYNSEPAQKLLPAELIARLRFAPPEYLDMSDLTHPMLRRYDEWGGVGELAFAAVRRYWKVEPTDGSATIATFSDARRTPALLERASGRGRTVLMTTAVDLQGWSDLPRTVWPFIALADQMMQYLTRQGESRLNYTAGETVIVRLDPDQPIRRYLLQKPEFQQLPGEVRLGATSVTIEDADQLGHFRLISAEADSKFSTGFSVNPPAGESDFSRLTAADLDRMLGEKRYSQARTIEELDKHVVAGRVGVEVFPSLVLLLIVIFCGEHLVANRFYEADQSAEGYAGKTS